MIHYFKNFGRRIRKIRKEGLLIFLLAIGLIVACQGALEDGNPFGPSSSNIIINPSTPKVNKAGTLTFTTIGGTPPVSWSISNTAIGNILADTGVFTALAIAGTATITVVDSVGDTDTATIEVLPNLLVVTPGSSTQNVAGAEIFTAAGVSGVNLLVATIVNDSSTSTFTLPTLAATATTVTVTYTIPTTAQGNQTFTITITDTEDGDVGAVKLTLIAP